MSTVLLMQCLEASSLLGEVAAVGRSAIRRLFFDLAHSVLCIVGRAHLEICSNVATTGQ